MRIGVFADIHDHLDHLKLAVDTLNGAECELALFAGDFVSTFVTPFLRRLRMPLISVFGDNDGNCEGLRAGVELVGPIYDGVIGIRLADGTRILMAHRSEDLSKAGGDAEVVIHAHTHRPRIQWDDAGRLIVNPGETSGWTSGRATLAILETQPLAAEIRTLAERPKPTRDSLSDPRSGWTDGNDSET